MAFVAKALQVVHIHSCAPFVNRHNMVDHRGRGNKTAPFALLAKRIRVEFLKPAPPPSGRPIEFTVIVQTSALCDPRRKIAAPGRLGDGWHSYYCFKLFNCCLKSAISSVWTAIYALPNSEISSRLTQHQAISWDSSFLVHAVIPNHDCLKIKCNVSMTSSILDFRSDK